MTLDQQYRNVLILLAVVIVAGSTYWILRHFRPSLFIGERVHIVPIEDHNLPSPSASVKPAPKPPEIVVHVAGAVQSPGVYRLSPEARVIDAIEKAGGATEDADVHRLNLAQKIRDGQQIYVPFIPETTDSTADAPVVDPRIRSVPTPQSVTRVLPSMDSPLIDLNTALSAEQVAKIQERIEFLQAVKRIYNDMSEDWFNTADGLKTQRTNGKENDEQNASLGERRGSSIIPLHFGQIRDSEYIDAHLWHLDGVKSDRALPTERR